MLDTPGFVLRPMNTLDRFAIGALSHPWAAGIIIPAVLLAVAEFGYRLGLRLYRANDVVRRTQIATLQAAILGMFGLLIGFTFSMSVDRDKTRRELVINEANSIRTTYFRASLLPEPQRSAVESLLRDYLDVRIDFQNAEMDEVRIERDEIAAQKIRAAIWKQALASLENKASDSLLIAYINSLNETIDYDTARVNALHSRVPGIVWLLLLLVAGFGVWSAGYGAGAHGTRARFSTIGLPLVTAFVIVIVADIERPYHGLIGMSQQSLLDLREEINPHEPK